MRRLSLIAPVLLAAVLCMGAACSQRVSDAVKEANPIAAGCEHVSTSDASVALCGYSIYGTFVTFQKFGLNVASALPAGHALRDGVIAAEEKAKPVADDMLAAVTAFEAARVDLAAGKTTAEKVAAAAANVQSWIAKARPLIDDLVAAVTKARASTPSTTL